MIRIGVDVTGGDKEIKGKSGIETRVLGAIAALKELPQDVVLVLYGVKDDIEKVVPFEKRSKRIEIVDSSESIEDIMKHIKAGKKDGGILSGLNAGVSAGDTGELVTGSIRLGRINVDGNKFNPALTSFLPKTQGGKTLVLDLGGSSAGFRDNEHMMQTYLDNLMLAISYFKASNGGKEPTFGILNIGSEDYKGPKGLQLVHKKFKETFGRSFIGNIEGNQVLTTEADIIVTDGFTGNMVLKSVEGVARGIGLKLKDEIISDVFPKFSRIPTFDQIRAISFKPLKILKVLSARFGIIFLLPLLKSLKNQFNPDNYSGAPILGINGLVYKSHGSSSSEAIKIAILKAYNDAKGNVVDEVKDELERLKREIVI